uniref:Uncharacterized protein n=1 Tax=Anguilla anguilla TaxID=7936 RepID=A0A0E9UGB9_ANGAN
MLFVLYLRLCDWMVYFLDSVID